MPNKIANTSSTKARYYQIPIMLMKHEGMTPSHITVFAYLYDQLRQEPGLINGYNKTNKVISENSLVGISQTKERLNDLEKWGFLIRTGMGSSRKFFLGEKFSYRPESAPVSKIYRPESAPVQAGIDTSNRPESGLHNKNSFNSLSNTTTTTVSPSPPNLSSSSFSQDQKTQLLSLKITLDPRDDDLFLEHCAYHVTNQDNDLSSFQRFTGLKKILANLHESQEAFKASGFDKQSVELEQRTNPPTKEDFENYKNCVPGFDWVGKYRI